MLPVTIRKRAGNVQPVDPSEWVDRYGDYLFQQGKFLEQLAKCLEALPPNLGSAFILREIDGADTKEICLHRARARIGKSLRDA
ncbi:MAG: hypothetical protein H6Q84_3363 [Deltaproteobacteria bacterium]|nr:hypothetical protein [Deltaproteobacteria bacterium]